MKLYKTGVFFLFTQIFIFTLQAEQIGLITTLVGGFEDNVQATSTSLQYPTGIAVDNSGNLYVSDYYNAIIRKVSNGIISRIAGKGGDGFAGDNGPAVDASINSPKGMTVDNSGNVYFCDEYNHRIRKFDLSGIISTIAGNGTDQFSGDGGLAVNASLNYPAGITVDTSGIIYIADLGNRRIRRIALNGTISTIAGTGTDTAYGDSGPAVSAGIGRPAGINLDANGNVYIADMQNHIVRKIDASGTITRIAGTGSSGFSGDGGNATSAKLNAPYDVKADSSGNIYVADFGNHCIRKITSAGTITTCAGQGTVYGFTGDNGNATSAKLFNPRQIWLDKNNGILYIADYWNNRIRKVDQNGIITSVAGNGVGDAGKASSAMLHFPTNAFIDKNNNIYVADCYNNRIRKIDGNGIITTIAGTDSQGFGGDAGPATSALLNHPYNVCKDSQDNFYISDMDNNKIRKVSANGNITTIAGTDSAGYGGDNGTATSAVINSPRCVVCDKDDNVYIADYNNHRIRKIDGNGIITTIAGTGTAGFSGDGGPASSAQLNYPSGIKVDDNGNIFIVDRYNHRIRKITNGIIQTIAGTGSAGYAGDGGSALQATFNYPFSIDVDDSGNIYIADNDNFVVRKITSDGTISTIAGRNPAPTTGILDNIPANESKLSVPRGVAVDCTGNIYVIDYWGSRLRKVTGVKYLSGDISISEGNATNSKGINLNLNCPNATDMIVSENSSFTGASWESYSTSKSYELSEGTGIKTVYVKFKASFLVESPIYSDTVNLNYDFNPPSFGVVIAFNNEPGREKEITVTVSCSEKLTGEPSVLISPHNDNSYYEVTMSPVSGYDTAYSGTHISNTGFGNILCVKVEGADFYGNKGKSEFRYVRKVENATSVKITHSDGAELEIPAEIFKEDLIIKITKEDFSVNSDSAEKADYIKNNNLKITKSGYEFTTSGSNQFTAYVKMSIPYNGGEISGMDEKNLRMCYWDATAKKWERIERSYCNASEKKVIGYTKHFSVFRIIEYSPSDTAPIMPAEKVFNYPNPVKGNYTTFRYYVSKNSSVKIRIYTVSGEKIAELDGYGAGGSSENEIKWDTTDIKSDVYVYVIEAIPEGKTSGTKVIKKLAIIK